jgi:nicotinate phosphoribosyltransferase
MEKNHSEIDVYAIGTNIATCKKQPALGLVCKLTEINKQPKMKFSADLEKTTLPGSKLVYRVWTGSSSASFDVIALEGEQLQPGEAKFFSLAHAHEELHSLTRVELMNQPLDLYHFTHTLAESREHVQQSMEELPGQLFQLHRPDKFKVLVTESFASMLMATKMANALKL